MAGEGDLARFAVETRALQGGNERGDGGVPGALVDP